MAAWRARLGILTIAVMTLALVGCQQTGRPSDQASPSIPATGSGAKKLTIATSTAVLADLVRNVAGKNVDVVAVVPPDRVPAVYEVDPRDGIAIERASVFFANGYGYEPPTLGQMILSASGLKVVILSEGLKVKESVIDHGDHDHRFPNPYFYLDVDHTIAYVERIRRTLAEVDPARASEYETNAKAYTERLRELDSWIKTEVSRIPETRRKFLTDHASFPYFAERYGIGSFAASYEGTAEAAPSPSQYAFLIGQVKGWGVPIAFGEEGLNPKLLQQLARDTGIRFVPGLRTSTLDAGAGAGTYIDMMKRNTTIIVGALS